MNAPPRNAIGSTTRFAIAVAACWVLATEPTSSPMDMKARVPQISTGIAIHQDAVSLRPKYGVVATSRNTANWTSATSRLTPTLANTTEPMLTGASRSRRSSLLCRQLTSVMAAPKVAPDAMAQPSSPGVRYWIGLSEASSTCLVWSWIPPLDLADDWSACCTIEEKTVWTMLAVVWSAIE